MVTMPRTGVTVNSESPPDDPTPLSSKGRSATLSSVSGSLRRVSQGFQDSNLPNGFSAATGSIASTIFSRQVKYHGADTSSRIPEVDPQSRTTPIHETAAKNPAAATSLSEPPSAAPFPNGYHFPPKSSFGRSARDGALAFWHYATTPVGLCVTIYGLNIVAWGGMLFLLLCNASPAMCHPSCNDIDSPRRKWIEWDSQILNALFCVTGFGLAPWRFRDLYYILQYRVMGNTGGLRRLASIHRGWFRLPGSDLVPVDITSKNVEARINEIVSTAVPLPETTIPDAPLTAVRAPASQVWKLDLTIWLMVWNTIFQVILAVFMWHFNRYNRPSWATGLFVALGCLVAAVGGYIMFLEGKRVKSIEGVPLSQADLELLERDREKGIWHFNNLEDKNVDSQGKGQS